MPGKYPDKIRTLPLFDGRFDAYKLAAEVEHAAEFEQDTDEIEFWFEPAK